MDAVCEAEKFLPTLHRQAEQKVWRCIDSHSLDKFLLRVQTVLELLDQSFDMAFNSRTSPFELLACFMTQHSRRKCPCSVCRFSTLAAQFQ